MSNIEHSSSSETLHYLAMKPNNSMRNKHYPCLVLRVVLQQELRVNCIRVPCGPSRTETGNFPQPSPWKRSGKRRQPWSHRQRLG